MPKKDAATPVERTVLAVERSIAILDSFLEAGGPLTLSDLERRSGLFKSVILRYMLSFERHGYVFKRADGTYRLGPRLFQLGNTYQATFDISEVLLPILRRLSQQTGESASFYLREGEHRLCLLRVDSPQAVRVSVHVGSLLPLDETATGQVLGEFGASSTQAATAIAETRWVRISSGIGESLTASISAPVYGAGDVFVGALTVSGVTARFRPQDQVIADLLIDGAAQASREFGARNFIPSCGPRESRLG